MASIDRSGLSFNTDLGGYAGMATLSGHRFDVFVKAWDGDWEAAWRKAEQGAALFLSRFHEVEAAVASELAPELDHWTDEPITAAEITERVSRAMHGKAVIGLHANEESASLFFDGPPLVLGHRVQVALCRDGQVSVGLAG
ncbi:MAG: hypothetical protein JNM56_13875 [Planctomycetia bacterium]|nr:hypothetical protein [Planctomycetia bacterium]